MRKLRTIPQSIRAHLGHAVEELVVEGQGGYWRSKTIAKLRRFEQKHLIPNGSVIDYLLTEHHASKSIKDLAQEIGVDKATIRLIFQRLHLPYLNKAQTAQRRMIQEQGAYSLRVEQRREMSRIYGAIGGRKAFELKKGFHGLSREQRRRIGRESGRRAFEQGTGIHSASFTPEQRSERAREGWASLTPEQHAARMNTLQQKYQLWCDSLTTEQKHERVHRLQQYWDSLTPEQRREQKTENGRKGRLASGMEPNGLEGSIIASLKEAGIYATDRGTAQLGQVYYTDTKENPWWICLADGRKKRPDFKVKGQRKVIEVYGEYWHSEEHCKPKGLPEYHWNAVRMIEEYAKVGYQCRVYWETDLIDPLRRAAIVQEIVAFAQTPEPINESGQEQMPQRITPPGTVGH